MQVDGHLRARLCEGAAKAKEEVGSRDVALLLRLQPLQRRGVDGGGHEGGVARVIVPLPRRAQVSACPESFAGDSDAPPTPEAAASQPAAAAAHATAASRPPSRHRRRHSIEVHGLGPTCTWLASMPGRSMSSTLAYCWRGKALALM